MKLRAEGLSFGATRNEIRGDADLRNDQSARGHATTADGNAAIDGRACLQSGTDESYYLGTIRHGIDLKFFSPENIGQIMGMAAGRTA